MAIKKNLKIYQSNDIIEARYNLSALEKNIWTLLVGQINAYDKDFKPYVFETKDILKDLKMGEKNYQHLYDATEGLLKKPITIIRQDNSMLQCNIISSADYSPDRSIVTLKFDSLLKPYLLQLKERYTSYKLEVILGLRSIYSKRLYELLKQYEKIVIRRIGLGELKEILGIGDDYKLYGHFKAKVLEVARKELDEKTDIHFTFAEEKKGNKVIAIVFSINSKMVSPEEIEETVKTARASMEEARKKWGKEQKEKAEDEDNLFQNEPLPEEDQ